MELFNFARSLIYPSTGCSFSDTAVDLFLFSFYVTSSSVLFLFLSIYSILLFLWLYYIIHQFRDSLIWIWKTFSFRLYTPSRDMLLYLTNWYFSVFDHIPVYFFSLLQFKFYVLYTFCFYLYYSHCFIKISEVLF